MEGSYEGEEGDFDEDPFRGIPPDDALLAASNDSQRPGFLANSFDLGIRESTDPLMSMKRDPSLSGQMQVPPQQVPDPSYLQRDSPANMILPTDLGEWEKEMGSMGDANDPDAYFN